jgi:sec-independent protein translocase protein TatC
MARRFNFGLSNGLVGALSGQTPGPDGEMPFLDHLEELRWRIIWSLVTFVIMGGIGIWISLRFNLIALLIDPARPYLDCSSGSVKAAEVASKVLPCDPRLAFTSITDPMFIQVKLGLLLGLLLSFPVIAYQAWAFLSPALHQKEKRVLVPALYAGLLLFVAGALLAYFYLLPSTARIMLSFVTPDMRQVISIGGYIDLVAKLMVAMGLVFELPVVMLILSSLGLVTSKFLKKNRRFAIAIMAVAAAVLTPGDAVSATIYMMLPLLFLFEVSIWLVMVVEKRRARNLAALREGEDEDDSENDGENDGEMDVENTVSETADAESRTGDVEQW